MKKTISIPLIVMVISVFAVVAYAQTLIIDGTEIVYKPWLWDDAANHDFQGLQVERRDGYVDFVLPRSPDNTVDTVWSMHAFVTFFDATIVDIDTYDAINYLTLEANKDDGGVGGNPPGDDELDWWADVVRVEDGARGITNESELEMWIGTYSARDAVTVSLDYGSCPGMRIEIVDVGRPSYGGTEFGFQIGEAFYEYPAAIPLSDCDEIPVANANGPYLVAVEQSVSLDSSGSFDPWGRPISLTWTLEDPTLGAISDSTFTANNQAGITNAVLTVDNGFGGISTDTAMLIIYDPEGGFVTGGGWFDSPGEAYVPDPTLTGKAVFGFVSKYKKGASIPTGNTEFVFQAADLNFHGTAYDWLVVNQGGSNAQFKGSGKINGSGDYRFMLWAGDKDTDTFRIRIWEEIGGVETDIYDNDIDQDIGGGSIVIHVKN